MLSARMTAQKTRRARDRRRAVHAPVLLRRRTDGLLRREILDDAFWVVYGFMGLPQAVAGAGESGEGDDD